MLIRNDCNSGAVFNREFRALKSVRKTPVTDGGRSQRRS